MPWSKNPISSSTLHKGQCKMSVQWRALLRNHNQWQRGECYETEQPGRDSKLLWLSLQDVTIMTPYDRRTWLEKRRGFNSSCTAHPQKILQYRGACNFYNQDLRYLVKRIWTCYLSLLTTRVRQNIHKDAFMKWNVILYGKGIVRYACNVASASLVGSGKFTTLFNQEDIEIGISGDMKLLRPDIVVTTININISIRIIPCKVVVRFKVFSSPILCSAIQI